MAPIFFLSRTPYPPLPQRVITKTAPQTSITKLSNHIALPYIWLSIWELVQSRKLFLSFKILTLPPVRLCCPGWANHSPPGQAIPLPGTKDILRTWCFTEDIGLICDMNSRLKKLQKSIAMRRLSA